MHFDATATSLEIHLIISWIALENKLQGSLRLQSTPFVFHSSAVRSSFHSTSGIDI